MVAGTRFLTFSLLPDVSPPEKFDTEFFPSNKYLNGVVHNYNPATKYPNPLAVPRLCGKFSSEKPPGRTLLGWFGGIARKFHWNTPSTTPLSNDVNGIFEITHPFHPLKGRVFPLVKCHRNWGEERVYYHDEAGELCSMPLAWTNLVKNDPFVHISAGRSAFRVSDLLELARLLDDESASAENMK